MKSINLVIRSFGPLFCLVIALIIGNELWPLGDKQALNTIYTDLDTISSQLNEIYTNDIKPIEMISHFDKIVAPIATPGYFSQKPIILIMGQFSTGKTTFINYLINSKYPGQHISASASTNKFIIVETSQKGGIFERLLKNINGKNNVGGSGDYIPGNQLILYDELPWSQFKHYDTKTLDSFGASIVSNNNNFLNKITLIDTPGVLSSTSVWQNHKLWKSFFELSHMIIILFDEKSCDFNDEMISLLEMLEDSIEKTRFVLNKADLLKFSDILQVYGSLSRNIGKIYHSGEASRVYLASLWKYQPQCNDTCNDICNSIMLDQQSLMDEINRCYDNGLRRKLDSFNHRLRRLEAHITFIYQMQILKNNKQQKFSLFGNNRNSDQSISKLNQFGLSSDILKQEIEKHFQTYYGKNSYYAKHYYQLLVQNNKFLKDEQLNRFIQDYPLLLSKFVSAKGKLIKIAQGIESEIKGDL